MTYENLREVFERLGVLAYIKLGDGTKSSFYLCLAEYKGELRLTFYTVNERSMWIGGRYSLPIELAPKVFSATGRILKALKQKREMIEKHEQGYNK